MLLALAALPAGALESTRHVPLQEFTRLELELVPQLGTRLTFPFLLTDNRSAVPFHTTLTNSTVFTVSRPVKGDNAIPHNSLVVTVNGGAGLDGRQYLGNLFISAGGYQITVLLRTTNAKRRHVQDVIFDLTQTERTHLIDEAVKAKLEAMEATNSTDIDAMARREARRHVARVALEDPRDHAIKEARKKQGVAEVYLDRILEYSEYQVLLFEVDNLSAGDLRVQGVQVVDAAGVALDSHYYCPEIVSGDRTVECALVTEQVLLAVPELTFSLVTDRGQVDVTW